MMSASWDPPGVTHDLLEYLKAESIREESVLGGLRNRSEGQNGVSEPPTHLLLPAGQVILVRTCASRSTIDSPESYTSDRVRIIALEAGSRRLYTF